MSTEVVIGFVAVVFAAVFLLMLALTTSASSDSRMRRIVRRRMERIKAETNEDVASILREKYLTSLTPLERRLEELPFMRALADMGEQAGRPRPGYQVATNSVVLALIAGPLAGLFLHNWLFGLGAAAAAFSLPVLRLSMGRRRRMDKIDEQMPDAIDVVKRALRAGHPFNSAIQLVAYDMDPPISKEFELMFSDLSYGNDVRRALLGLMERVPSVNVMALVTAVLVQRETGGNLAEILDQIGKVVRERFRFDRKVRTLSAEGKMSAWVLSLIPLALVLMLSISSPNYLPILLTSKLGHTMLYAAGGLGVLGILWIRRIIRIEV
jgi:tight adherence protein B